MCVTCELGRRWGGGGGMEYAGQLIAMYGGGFHYVYQTESATNDIIILIIFILIHQVMPSLNLFML